MSLEWIIIKKTHQHKQDEMKDNKNESKTSSLLCRWGALLLPRVLAGSWDKERRFSLMLTDETGTIVII